MGESKNFETFLWLIIGLFIVVAAVAIILALIFPYKGYYGYGMMGLGYGMMGFGILFMLIPLIFFILIFYFIIKIVSDESSSKIQYKSDAMEILNQRYASGQITEEQYNRIKEKIKQN